MARVYFGYDKVGPKRVLSTAMYNLHRMKLEILMFYHKDGSNLSTSFKFRCKALINLHPPTPHLHLYPLISSNHTPTSSINTAPIVKNQSQITTTSHSLYKTQTLPFALIKQIFPFILNQPKQIYPPFPSRKSAHLPSLSLS